MSPAGRQEAKAVAFRALHAGEPFVIPNPWDAGSARVLAALGFAALATTSSGFAFTLGRRDGGVTLDEVVDHVASVDGATDLPVSVDLENGYGADPESAARAIRRVAEAGAVGGSIEDYDPGRLPLRAAAGRRADRRGGRGRARAGLPVHADGTRREPHPRQPRPRRHDRAAPRVRGGGRGRPVRAGPAHRRGDPRRVRRRVGAGERARASRSCRSPRSRRRARSA